nr:hypothetical protein BaRGS_012445 [Batillaria attramentaria]
MRFRGACGQGKNCCMNGQTKHTGRLVNGVNGNDEVNIKKKHPNCKFVIGNTEIGIETKFKKQLYPVLVSATSVPELLLVDHTPSGIRLSGGNIMTASPISDLNPLLLACGAQLQVVSTDGHSRILTMDSNFFLGYRKTAVKPTEILVSVLIPFTKENEYFYGFKQATRKEDDTSIVNAGILVELDEESNVTDAALAFGGMAPVTVMATKTRNGLIGHLLCEDLPLEAGAVGGMVQYRRTLTLSFFFKFYLAVLQKLQQQDKATSVPLSRSYVSATQAMERSLPRGSQVYEAVCEDQSPDDALHRPLVHQSAYRQASGEAVYLDDIPVAEGELYMSLVMSTEAHARLVKVDPSPALAMPGVVDFVSHLDLPGINSWGHHEDKVFATDEVIHQGEVIGAVVAESQAIGQHAAAAVIVQYEKLDAIITIKDAIAKESFFPPKHVMERGDLEKGFSASDHVVEGEVHVEAQEHFYMETNAALVRPGEDGEMEVIASTQGPSGIQQGISGALGIPQHKIVVRTKRLGGGFGGKETRTCALAIPLAVAANNYNIPNMRVTGIMCKTNMPSSTAFRGFGGPQGMVVAETWIAHVAAALSMAPEKVAKLDLFSDWLKTFARETEARGGALVHIYTDGTVLMTHGGVEMGQGLHTKMIQVASRVLQVPASKITILETATHTVPNTTPTAASMSSDIYGEAVKEACQTLKDRLDKFRKSREIGYDIATNTGKPFAYFTYGAACAEVEIDCLTGDHKVLATDIVMDIGKSLNPTIDVGQIEGGFVQGYGLMLLEQYKVRPDGTLLTRGPGTYKLPSLVQDAIASARVDAGLEPHTILDTPATPDRIRMACGDRFTKQVTAYRQF